MKSHRLLLVAAFAFTTLGTSSVLGDISITVPAEANTAFAGQTQSALEAFAAPSADWEDVSWDVGGEGNDGNFHNDTADWEGVVRAFTNVLYNDVADRTASSLVPPSIDVSGWEAAGDQLSITATGLWGRGPSFSFGPDGHSGNGLPDAEYFDFRIAGANAPKASLVGLFLTDAVPESGSLEHPLALPSTLVFGTDDMTTPGLQQVFVIGSSLDNITIPTGASRLFFGFHNGHEWWNNDGDMTVTVVPAPGAALLAMLGLPMIGWAKRRFS